MLVEVTGNAVMLVKLQWRALQAVSDAHTHLFEERERLLQLRAENDALRAQEVADRARIQRLLSLGPHAANSSQVNV
jgi:hypothetical protein